MRLLIHLNGKNTQKYGKNTQKDPKSTSLLLKSYAY